MTDSPGNSNSDADSGENEPGVLALQYASATERAAGNWRRWLALVFGAASVIPMIVWGGIEAGAVPGSALWFDAGDHVIFLGVMGLGPLLGCLAVTTSIHRSTSGEIARMLGILSMAVGSVMSIAACIFALPLVLWNFALVTCASVVVRRRRGNYRSL